MPSTKLIQLFFKKYFKCLIIMIVKSEIFLWFKPSAANHLRYLLR